MQKIALILYFAFLLIFLFQSEKCLCKQIWEEKDTSRLKARCSKDTGTRELKEVGLRGGGGAEVNETLNK